MSIARMTHKEGGGKDGVKAALTYAVNCVILGKHWVKFDSMTGTIKFYYVEHSISDEYSTAWTTFQEWAATPDDGRDGPCPPAQ